MNAQAAMSLTTYVSCWMLQRTDGAGVALTGHDRPVRIGDTLFAPAPGILPSSITRSLGEQPSSSEVEGAISSHALTQLDLKAGRWSGASVRLSLVSWDATYETPIELAAGELGEVAIEDEKFSAQLIGPSHQLQRPVCPQTSPECRASFGDDRCRIDLAGRTVRGTLASAVENVFEFDRDFDDRYLFGRARWIRGANCGFATAILSVNGRHLTLREAPRLPVQAGEIILVSEGCDKRLSTCSGRFSNVVNFRGEPYVPGNDLLTRYPGG